ncbi:MAG: extracellular solute-binding protein [Mycobacteriales bacterium]
MARRWFQIAAVLTAGVSLVTACGGVGGDKSSKKGGPITTQGFSLPDEIAKVRIAEARKAVGDIKVNEGAFDQQQFLSSVAAGSPTDLVYIDREYLGTYASRGAIQPLDSCISKQGIKMDQFRQPAVDQVKLKGKTYGVPEFNNVRVLITNNTAVSDAHLDGVRTSDWSALTQAATAMARQSGGKLSRIGFDPKIPEFLPMWAHANGVDLISKDGKKVHLTDPRVVEALQFTVDLINKQGGWASFKAFRDSWDFFGGKNEFVADQLGSFPMENFYVNTLSSLSPSAGITVTPFTDRNNQPMTWATGNAWAIPKGAKHFDKACRFIKVMTDPKTWLTAAKARVKAIQAKHGIYTGTYTANKVADEEIFSQVYKPSGNKAFDDAVKTLQTVQEHAFSTPAVPAGKEIVDAWQSAVNRVLSGQQSPAAALAQAQTEAQTALDKAWKG